LKQWKSSRKVNKMASNKEHLKLLLEFISKIIEQEGNEWFHDELALLITKKIITEKDSGIKLAAVSIKEIGSIDRYIENGVIPIIDFEEVEDESVKYTLIRDCIEMGKCRFSHFSREQSFLDFCKYAFFQIEQLVNYYLLRKNGNSFAETIKYIKSHNPNAILEKNKTIGSIPFSVKLFAISNQTRMKQDIKSILDKVSYARNNSLHRSPEKVHSLAELTPLFNVAIKKEKSEQTQNDQKIIQEFYYQKFIEDRDYNIVTISVIELKNILVLNL
jgi:hypothetical protein